MKSKIQKTIVWKWTKHLTLFIIKAIKVNKTCLIWNVLYVNLSLSSLLLRNHWILPSIFLYIYIHNLCSKNGIILVVWMRMAPISSYISMPGPQLVELLGCWGRIRKHGLVRRCMLGVGFKIFQRFPPFTACPLSHCSSVMPYLLACSHAPNYHGHEL